MKCLLCESEIELFFKQKNKEYYKCQNCFAISLNPKNFLSKKDEIARYKTHNNDVKDKGYQNFVKPIVSGVFSNFNSTNLGLDFGCGTGPVITKLLRDKDFQILTYDPFFDNDKNVLKNKYDYIVCCEVIEHFHNPRKEFKLLKSLLKPKGKLFCMTDVFDKSINFEKWYYKNDDTHVIFYQNQTFEWIKKAYGFSKVTVKNRLIVFER